MAGPGQRRQGTQPMLHRSWGSNPCLPAKLLNQQDSRTWRHLPAHPVQVGPDARQQRVCAKNVRVQSRASRHAGSARGSLSPRMIGRSGAAAACARALNLDFSRRGKPTDNATIESFRDRPPRRADRHRAARPSIWVTRRSSWRGPRTYIAAATFVATSLAASNLESEPR